jgi:hypothetical protein
MIKLKPLRPPTQEPVSAGSKERFIVDCGRVSERTRGAPVGFWGEAGWPPYVWYVGS